mgnify:CR=1 FL=1
MCLEVCRDIVVLICENVMQNNRYRLAMMQMIESTSGGLQKVMMDL